jgi:hypothetical protein
MLTVNNFIDEMITEGESIISIVNQKFTPLNKTEINIRPAQNSWSIGECFEHLIRSNSPYIEYYKDALKNNSNNSAEKIPFKHSLIGRLIIKSVKPSTKMKVKTPVAFNPINSSIEENIVHNFLEMHKTIMELIAKCKSVDLSGIKIHSPFNKLVRYNLGDSFKITMLHSRRHIQQAERVMNSEVFITF